MASVGQTEPGLLQTEVCGTGQLRAWRVIIATLMLKQTRNEQARPVVNEVLKRWPTPEHLLQSGPELEELLQPTGFKNKRATEMRLVSSKYAGWLDGYVHDPGRRAQPPGPPPAIVRQWRGCGEYVEDAVRLLVWRDTSKEPADKRLKEYWEWLSSKTSS